MPRGGKRPGAGRKPQGVYPGVGDVPHLAYLDGETAPAFAKRVLSEHLPSLLQVALTKAIKEGDARMLIYCTDRMLGSPVQPLDLEIRRTAERVAAQTGADPEWLVKRAAEIVAAESGRVP